jgi:hypothetical protein
MTTTKEEEGSYGEKGREEVSEGQPSRKDQRLAPETVLNSKPQALYRLSLVCGERYGKQKEE